MRRSAWSPATVYPPARHTTRTTRTALATALAATALLSAPAIARAQEPAAAKPDRFTLTGRILDRSTGLPLAGAIVEIESIDRGAVTDTLGAFAVPRIPQGRYTLAVHQLGYADAFRTVAVDAATGLILVELEPRPVLLEGITVQIDRLRRRRNATATTVRAFERRDLLLSAASNAETFIRSRAMVMRTSCPGERWSQTCVFARGRAVPVSVYIDEVPAIGGLDQLAMYRPEELYLIEVYGGGRHIRAYTTWFMERAAARQIAIFPIF